MGMKQRGGSEKARRNQRVIIGPWTHMNLSGSFPERAFGPSASSAAIKGIILMRPLTSGVFQRLMAEAPSVELWQEEC
jgi:hypothetical protein